MKQLIIGTAVLSGIIAALIVIFGFLVGVPRYLLAGHGEEAITGLTIGWIVFWFSILFVILVDQ